ncbi:NTP transferase domain-containing protein [Verrucomicrobiaceae bacterium 5K15]|uniref:NTP transferase domain-containing protein n=1 Tax=Oceaniferula flava TaxID=2800421 RepID=A0AAE2SH83_9BACT|nr:sugar phosphate nucleotidyltransferase [Oceaniferula flavus]MBK1856311.1 NTP transferase domain-containing protein [Oceaniferula flavus]MBM1137618.1 NTP transferase domain-containing protein [Oceaniferula flavus]
MIHKAFILGAGLGTRLRPLTNLLPKPLVPVFHEPMANHALRHCQAAGITEFAINTHHLPDAWNASYPDGTFEGSPLAFFHEDVLLETGGGIRNIATFIGDDPLLVYNGDILTDIDIQQLIDHHSASNNVATLALRSSGENCNVNIAGDQVSDMRNLLGSAAGTHQFTGVYCINAEILDLIPDEQVVSIVPAFIELIQAGKLGAVVLDEGDWFDIGNPQAYRDVHDYLRQKRDDAIHPDAQIHPDAEVDESSCVIGPGAIVEAGARLENCIVWPGIRVPAGSQHRDAILTGAI